MYLETATLVWVLLGSLIFLFVSTFMGDHHVEAGGDVEHDGMDVGGDTGHGVTTSELFSVRNVALLAAGFAAASIIARNANYGVVGTNVAGILGAVVMVAVGVWLFRIIRRQESNSITSNTDLVGKIAYATIGIPEQGFGEVTLRNAHGVSTSLAAKTNNGSAVPAGAEVTITAVAGNVATVSATIG